MISDEGERLVQFITIGVSEQEIEAIGHWPHGHGILRLLIEEPHSLRPHDLSWNGCGWSTGMIRPATGTHPE